MSHLMAIAVGPVQEFIAAARRTRDLWFGSDLLSEISRTVAKSVSDGGCELIFPASINTANVANVILAELPTGDPKVVAAKAKQAAQDCWLEYAAQVRRKESRDIRSDMWDDQVNEVIEIYSAWIPHNNPSKYASDRKALMRLLAGRKNCRDFSSASENDRGLPKSSLDGQRATVLVEERRNERQKYPSRLRIRTGEQLDLVGLVKRASGGNHPYPSVSRIAADPWIQGNKHDAWFQDLLLACEQLPSDVCHRLDSKNFPQFADFPFEGTAVYRDRHHEWEEEIDPEDGLDLKDIQNALDKLPVPLPYLAILVADGDNMGATIANLKSANDHCAFSRDLAGFNDEAGKIVAKNNGILVYAGGDDVLAFLPVDKCLGCARELHDDFEKRLNTHGASTLSVGIAIGHFMDNLEDLLEYGRAAEKAAKTPDRNGLAVHLHKRGGAPIRVRSQWSQNPNEGLDERLSRFAKMIKDGDIPAKLPYELRAMAKLYENEQWGSNAGSAIQQDLYRLIAKKTSRSVDTVRQVLSEDLKDMTATKLLSFAQELLVARLFGEAMKQAEGRTKQVYKVHS